MSLSNNRQSVTDAASAIGLSPLKKTREISLCNPGKEPADAGLVIMEKLCQITDRLDTFLEGDKSRASALPDIRRLGVGKCRPRLSDAGLAKAEAEEEVKTFNIDGIHFEVSAQKNQVTSSYLPQMNLIHYNFARSSVKPSLKSKKTETYLRMASSSGKLKTYQPQQNPTEQKKSHKIFIRPDFKLKPLASHKPQLRETEKYSVALASNHRSILNGSKKIKLNGDSVKTLHANQYRKISKDLRNHENINELSSEEDK
eukprot:TRINITY_DN5319_c0_g4_i2.p1 TRINITY_DN5319_c0_g4~~TRINITY_DN5319_c0_g4_i2.p1  ORF type:complete len:257 (+),score=73.30 TRINITY_DN5319_c0_g4_i2:246-1016(+)